MPELHVYATGAELPHHFYYQAESFSRIVWGESTDDYDIDLGLNQSAQHFVVAQGKRLISYASVIFIELELNGVSYVCGGIGGVMTFPAFRQRGYGGQVVQAATNAILQNPDADFGLLWTDFKNEHFYNQSGWEAMPGLTTLAGDPPEPYDDELRMMLFVSEKAKNTRADFEHGTLYVGVEKW